MKADVVVIGAGPAGSAAAFFLVRAGLDVLLIDRASFPRDKTCGDGLSPRALRVLEAMGCLPEILSLGQRVRSIQFISPVGSSVRAGVPHYASHPPYALVLPRLLLDDIVRRRAVAAGARFLGGTHVDRVEASAEGVHIAAGQANFVARAVVLATGASTALLRASSLDPGRPAHTVAARRYVEGIDHDPEEISFRFDGVPLPGYGWVFPTGPGRANVGAGTLADSAAFRRMGRNIRQTLTEFEAGAPMQSLLAGARPVGPVRSFPLRLDFAQASTGAPRLLYVGEACGLVNPLTGEGIDYALESGAIAAEFLMEILGRGRADEADWHEYDRRLRAKFQRLFVFTHALVGLYLQPWFLNRFIRRMQSRPDLTSMLVDITQGMRDAAQGLTPRTLLRILGAG